MGASRSYNPRTRAHVHTWPIRITPKPNFWMMTKVRIGEKTCDSEYAAVAPAAGTGTRRDGRRGQPEPPLRAAAKAAEGAGRRADRVVAKHRRCGAPRPRQHHARARVASRSRAAGRTVQLEHILVLQVQNDPCCYQLY